MKTHSFGIYEITTNSVQLRITKVWTDGAVVTWNENGDIQTKNILPVNAYRTQDEAEKHGIERAIQWIRNQA